MQDIHQIRAEIATIQRQVKAMGYTPDAARIRLGSLIADRRTLNVANARRAAKAKREAESLEAMERRPLPVWLEGKA